MGLAQCFYIAFIYSMCIFVTSCDIFRQAAALFSRRQLLRHGSFLSSLRLHAAEWMQLLHDGPDQA